MSARALLLPDELIAETIARQGGYEEVERGLKWASIANSLGLRKDMADAVKHRYEDMLRISAELDEQEEEEEDEEFEVDAILDSRIGSDGAVEYLVKWKFEDDGDGDDVRDNTTWEPRENLACPDLLQAFEEKQKRAAEDTASGDQGSGGAAAGDGVVAQEATNGSASSDGSALKRKAEGEPPSAEGDGAADANSEAPSACGYGPYLRILRAHKPIEGSALAFEVLLADGTSRVVLPSAKLRVEAPLMLVDFYEARLSFTAGASK